MSSKHTGTGTAMQVHKVHTRYVSARGALPVLQGQVARVRALLRTEMSCKAIAAQLGVNHQTLRHFCRQRNLVNWRDRARSIGYARAARGETRNYGDDDQA